jgi:CheY-like chemotaxis protein
MTTTLSADDKERYARKTVLIVEDDEAVAAFLQEVITSETPYRVLLASTGNQALSWVETHRPDLMLLDNQLPDTTGIALYDQFQQLDDLRRVPVLLMSAYPPRQEIARRQLRCLEKPFDLDELFQVLINWPETESA